MWWLIIANANSSLNTTQPRHFQQQPITTNLILAEIAQVRQSSIDHDRDLQGEINQLDEKLVSFSKMFTTFLQKVSSMAD